jgi:hypothetical protein
MYGICSESSAVWFGRQKAHPRSTGPIGKALGCDNYRFRLSGPFPKYGDE